MQGVVGVVAPATEDGGQSPHRFPSRPRLPSATPTTSSSPPASGGCQRSWVRRWVRGPRTLQPRECLPCNDYEHLDESSGPSGAPAGSIRRRRRDRRVRGGDRHRCDHHRRRRARGEQRQGGGLLGPGAVSHPERGRLRPVRRGHRRRSGQRLRPGRRERALVLRGLRHRVLRPADHRPRRRGHPRRSEPQRPDRADDAQHRTRATGAAVVVRQQHPDRGRPRRDRGVLEQIGDRPRTGLRQRGRPGARGQSRPLHRRGPACRRLEPRPGRVRARRGRRGGRRHRAADPVGPGVPQRWRQPGQPTRENPNTMPPTSR